MFNVRLHPGVDLWLAAAIDSTALGVALPAATLATFGVFAESPARLLRGERAIEETGGRGGFDG